LIKAITLQEILDHFKIDECNYLLIGDGSGSRWEYPVGFGCLMIEVETDWRDWFFGGFNCGTVNLAELMAYASPLLWLASLKRIKRTSTGACRVHILSDSEWCVRAGNGQWSQDTHKEIWAMFRQFRSRGIFLHWHWIPGHEGIPANEFADKLSKAARQSMLDIDPEPMVERSGAEDISGLYPA
jgi:ribonuclease HI